MAKGRVHLVIHGKVQGVFYRASAQEKAKELGLTGWVRNRPDKTVEIVAEGDEENLNALIEWSYTGPPDACVTYVDISWEPYTGEFRDFLIKYGER
jgi:acylphosphatase